MKHRKILTGPSNLHEGSAQELIDLCDQYEKIDLFMDGFGGFADEMIILQKYLNSRKDDINIYLQGGVYSCHAILAFLYCTNKVYIYPIFECVMFHLLDTQEYSRRKEDTRYKKFSSTDLHNKMIVEDLSNWLPTKKIKDFVGGKDVALSYNKVKKYFKNKENIHFL